MFKKIITAAASAAVVAGVLLAAPANAAGVPLAGGGSSFAAGAIKSCAADYTANTVTYTSSDSGTGRSNYANSTFNFAASDGTYAGTETFSGSNGVNYVTVPLLGGPVVFAYSAVGVNDGLKLTPAIVSGIFKGTITRWDDAALKTLNPKVKLPKKAIKVAYRSSGSGTTANLTTYLNQTSGSAWAANSKDLPSAAGQASVTYLDNTGATKSQTTSSSDSNYKAGYAVVVKDLTVSGTGSTASLNYYNLPVAPATALVKTTKTSSDSAWVADKVVTVTELAAGGFAPLSASFATSQLLSAYVEDNSNVFGYFDLSDAITADVGIAALQNAAGAFVMPTASAAAKFIGAQTPSTSTAMNLNGTLVIDFTKVVPGAYQLSIVTYGIAPKFTGTGKSTDASKLAVQDFFNYVVKTCIPAKAASLGYVALGGALKTSALNQIKLIG
jgi:ABC-type phosphate transport system substrate-binding protein